MSGNTEIVLIVEEADKIVLEVNHDGLSAYEIALKNGFVGTEAEWLLSLNGDGAGFIPENVANKDTDSTFAANSDTKYPSQKAVKTALSLKQDSLGYTAENTTNKSTSVSGDQASSTKYPTVKSVYDWVVATFQAALGYTPENVSNKKTDLSANSDTYYPTQKAVKTAVDAKQDSLGYTAENTANKSTSVSGDQASSTKYPTVKSVYDWVVATFQATLGYTPENVSNKKTDLSANSDTYYPSQKAVKTAVDAKQDSLGYTAENAANKDTDTSLAANSDTKYPSQKATKAYAEAMRDAAKTYADGLVVGLWDDRGSFDASGGAYPTSGGSGTLGAILKGDAWTISVAGSLPTGQVVEIGDVIRAITDTPGNTQANWAITQNNIGYTAENSANKSTSVSSDQASSTKYPTVKSVYDWAVATFQAALGYTAENAANKDTDSTFAANSDTKYPSQKAVKTAVDAKQNSLGYTAENSANKSTSVTSDQASSTKYPTVKSVYDWAVATFQAALGYTAENTANKDTDSTFAANSDTKYPSQKAVKTAVDAKQASLVSGSNIKTINGATLLGNSDIVLATLAGAETFSNKRITKRVLALSAGSATPSINTDSYDVVHITAQSAAITSFTTNLTGTPVDGDVLRISITDNGTARALTWGSSFESSTATLPTTTVVSTRLDVGFFWNSETSKWRCVAVA